MVATPLDGSRIDDPRKLREMLDKVAQLASDHRLTSVVVGMASPTGDLLFPEVVDFVESALRVDDSIVRMTRERSVLFLSDVDRLQAEEIMARILSGFGERFAAAEPPPVSLGFYEVAPHAKQATIKDVLPALFTVPQPIHH